MKFNLHTHTYRCHHATGTEREYIKNAIKSGIELLGFSEHIPCPFDDGHESFYRLYKDEIDLYFKRLRSLREEYADKIKILIGFEVEYYPYYFEKMMDFVKPYRPDYMILGQHFTYNEEDGHYCAVATDDESRLINYVEQSIAGLKTGKFTYLCHPDLINFIGDDKIYEKHMRYLCEEVKKLNFPLEFNFLGFSEGRPYPNKRFFKIVSEVGNDVVLGCDAHNPRALLVEDIEKRALEFLSEFNITPVDSVNIKYYST